MKKTTMGKALITGITGFVGSHLAELLLKKNHEVYGIVRWRSKTENIEHIRKHLKLVEADLLDAHSMENLIKRTKPDYIFHLAAQSFVLTSWHAPAHTLNLNIIGQVNLFEAIREVGINPVVQIACSSEEYGLVYPNEVPIKETNPLRPLSPYGVSKVAQDMLGWQYFKSHGIKVVRTRAFNHTGPRRGDVFAESTFAKQIAEIEKGKKEPVIEVGNLKAKRDYTDVRDMVQAYLLAVKKCKPGEVYNICSGRAHSIQEILNLLLSMSKKKIKVEIDPQRLRPSDVEVLVGDYSKFKKLTGWKPKISLKQTLEDLLNYWRKRV